MNILTMVVLAVLLLFAADGLRKGMVKKLAGIVALIVSSILVSVALPYITEFLKNDTPVYTFIVDQCEAVVSRQITASLVPSSAKKERESIFDRDQIKDLINQYGWQYGVSGDMVDSMSDSQLQKIVSQYLQDYIGQTDGQGSSGGVLSLTRIEETKLIQNMPIPDFLKNLILNYNNSEGYRKLSVNNFTGYLVQFFATILLNIVAFIVTLILVQIFVWAVISALKLFAKLPVLNLINHAGGLVVGILQGVFVVWMLFLLLAMFSGTDIGIMLMKMVDESIILKPLYESNMFLKIVVQAISNIM